MQTLNNKILDEIHDMKCLKAILGDSMIHFKRKDCLNHLVDILKALMKNGLKISPGMTII